ncbi:MAG TPA: tetratricopeptide repeat protein [Trichormus sp.]
MRQKLNRWTNPTERKLNIAQLAVAMAAAFVAANSNPSFAAAHSWQQFLAQGNNDLSCQNVAAAETNFRQALKSVEQTSHRTDDVVKCMSKLANVMALQNKTSDALELYKKSLSLQEKQYGRLNARELPTIMAIGSVYESLGNHDLATRMYHQASEIHARKFEPYNPAVTSALPNLHRVIPHVPAQPRNQRVGLDSADLDASHQLVNGLGKSHDRLRSNDSTDRDLLLDFQKQMSQSNSQVCAFDKNLNRAQATALKPSGKM